MTHTKMTVHLVGDAWTVGQLRAVLADVPDDVQLQACVTEDAGGGFVDEQVVGGAGLPLPSQTSGHERLAPSRVIERDFPTGDHVRGVR